MFTELGQLVNMMTNFEMTFCSFYGTMPTELGNLVKMESRLTFHSNSLTGSMPSEFGGLTGLDMFSHPRNTLTGSMPTELGGMVAMKNSFNLGYNSFTSSIPTEFGNLDKMSNWFQLVSNELCSDVPTQVQALSSQVTSGWRVTTGNSIGTVCGWIEDSRFPGAGDTSITSIDYSSQGLTGTIPTGDDVWKV